MPRQTRAAAHEKDADTTKAVDEFMRSLVHPAKAGVEALRTAILGAHLSVKEGVKWNAPSFRTTEYFATTNLRSKRGVGVILHFGAKARAVAAPAESISDPSNLLKWLAKDRATVNFESLSDLKNKKTAFQSLLRQWIAHVRP
jgi:hypothetical protein